MEKIKLERDDWAKDVKQAVNDLIDSFGLHSNNYDETAYAVFDFDNTTAIFDVGEQLAIHQLQTMSFAFTPKELPNILATGLSDLDKDLSDAGYGKSTYHDWIFDITNAYTKLYRKYGPFGFNGVNEKTQKIIHEDEQWLEFATKMCAMYDLVCDLESAFVACPWLVYWLTGMREDEVYALAKASHTYYKDVRTSKVTWNSPTNLISKVGPISYTWTAGIQVSENLKELWRVLKENGIDVWVCSATDINVIRAAVDVFGLHDYCAGVIAMTAIIKDGKYTNAYDYENGYCQYAEKNNVWLKGTIASEAQTYKFGKVIAIDNILGTKYGHGPLCGFMDATGDFNFCSEYQTLKLVVCFNRATRKVTDGGGLVAEVAMYEKESLNYDLKKANVAGDTLYVLQGRDENNLRSLRSSNKTIVFGSLEEKLFCDKKNEVQLQYMIDHHLTVKEAIELFAIKKTKDDQDNVLGFSYGFLEEYNGYHSR